MGVDIVEDDSDGSVDVAGASKGFRGSMSKDGRGSFVLRGGPCGRARWTDDVEGEDPSKHAASDSMLDGSNSTLNGMLMGAMVTAPLPEYPDDHIPPYNVHDAMYVDVIKDESFPAGDPSSEAASWLPKETTYDGAAEAWLSPPTKPQGIVDSLASAFKWTEKLVGNAPPLLLKNFKTVYLDIPSLTTS